MKALAIATTTVAAVTVVLAALLIARLRTHPAGPEASGVAPAPAAVAPPATAPAVASRLPDTPASAPEPIEARLEREFQALLAREPNPAPLQEAAGLLAEADEAPHWSSYQTALRIVREHRSLAAVPLLMKSVTKEAAFGAHDVPAFVDALTILTGDPIDLPNPAGADRAGLAAAAVEKLYDRWWVPGRAAITTDLAKMTDEQRRRVLTVLLEQVRRGLRLRPGREGSATAIRTLALAMANRAGPGRVELYSADLCPQMVPLLLERAGWMAEPRGEAPAVAAFPYELIPPLASLRRDGAAAMLDQAAADERQGTAARLVSWLAMHAAAEKTPGGLLVSLEAREKRLALRLVCIVAMQYAPLEDVSPRLNELADDPNQEVRTAAGHGLGRKGG